MTWRDRFLADRIGSYVIDAIDDYPLLLPIWGIDVSAGFVEMQPGSMGSFPVITVVLDAGKGKFPSVTAVPENGWASGSLDVRNAVWKSLGPLAEELAPTGNQAGESAQS